MNNEDIKIVKTNDNEFRYEGVLETPETPEQPDLCIPPYKYTDEELEVYEKFCDECDDKLPFWIL